MYADDGNGGVTEADADPESESGSRSGGAAGPDSEALDLAFELPNAGPGPDPLSPSAVAADFLVVVFQRDYYCGTCRRQVKALRRRYESFRERDAEVASVLPEPHERAAEWRAKYDLPFPTLADPDAEVGDRYDQPVRYGLLGRLHDVVGRMPTVAILDCRGETLALRFAHRGSSPADRPSPETLLARVDRVAASPVPDEGSEPTSTGTNEGEDDAEAAVEATERTDGESDDTTVDR